MLEILLICIVAGSLSYLGVAFIRWWARRLAILDVPTKRSSHDQPTPRGGGLAIVIITLGGWLVCTMLNPEWPRPTVFVYAATAVLVAGVSGLDDVRSVPIAVRLATHCLAAILVIWGIGYWKVISLPFLGEVDLAWVGLPITILWIVGLTNAYNFMDGIDGLAGGQAVIAGLGWILLGWQIDAPEIVVLASLIGATSAGFLGHNWPRARIFMGDVGSVFIGFTLAVLPVALSSDHPRMPFAGALLVWPFIFDTGFSFIRRLCRRENVFAAHRSHLYQQLVISGRSHGFVALLYIGLALIGMLVGLAWVFRDVAFPVLIILILGLGLWVFVRQQRKE
jgi:UDP-N-acetylmuramyl pentapeptide phosphotransferase/UDP-N-acetylglucosamine-1-phosphate transferase